MSQNSKLAFLLLVVIVVTASSTFFLLRTDFSSPKISSVKEWGSYAVAAKLVQDLSNQGIQVEERAFSQGVQDALRGRLKATRQVLNAHETQFRSSGAKKMSENADKNAENSRAFMDQNRNRTGVVTTKSGLQYLILDNAVGPHPSLTDWVEVSYEVRLLSGEVLESSTPNGEKVVMPVKMGLPALEEGFQLMTPNSRFRFFSSPELAYGSFSRPGIPANSVLLFDVTLFGIRKK